MTVGMRFLRDRRRTILWWTLGIGLFVLVTVATYPLLKEMPELDRAFGGNEDAQRIFGGQDGFTTPQGFLHSQFFSLMLPLLLIIFGIGVGARAIAGAEDDGTLELLLANPVTRTRVAVERYLSAIGQVTLLTVIASTFIVLFSIPFGLLDGLSLVNLLGACLACLCTALLFASLSYAWGASRGGRGATIAIGAATAVGSFVIYGFVSSGIVEFLRYVTPWWWYLSRNILAEGLPPEAVVVPLLVAAGLGWGGTLAFQRRDLH